MKPLVSLCMATYFRPQLFPESLASMLAQTYEPLEIIVLVDGACPESIRALEGCRDPRLQWFVTERALGMVPAWNAVCTRARGKYLLYCADDDVLLPRAVEEQVGLLEDNPSVLFCHADWEYVDDDGNHLSNAISPRGRYIERGSSAWARFLAVTGACMQTTVIRREAFTEVGGWDEEAGLPGDNGLYLRLLVRGDVGHVPVITCKYRVRMRNPDNWERNFRTLRDNYALGVRHLTAPPPGAVGELTKTRRRFFNRLAMDGVTLRDTAPSAGERHSLLQWLEQHVWPQTMFGRLCEGASRAGASRLLGMLVSAHARGRQRAKNALVSLRRVAEPLLG